MKWWPALVAIVLYGSLGAAWADDMRPIFAEINEIGDRQYMVRLRNPNTLAKDSVPVIEFPGHCRTVHRKWAVKRYACADSLAGVSLRVRYPETVAAYPTILRIRLSSGAVKTIAMTAGDDRFEFPAASTVSSVASQYTWLGMQHIGKGVDHLLFVACLIWIAGTWQRIVATISGFTLAHSATLAISALEIVRIPIPPTEAVIALSVLLLAREVLDAPGRSLTWRYPVLVSSIFGLVHGLGFAAVLTEIGLPQQNIVAGLLFFNMGVELGQLAFALLFVAILHLLRHSVQRRTQDYVRIVTAYGIGSVAAYWLVSRMAAFS